jgi:DNA-binding response OmpR family regulator
LDCLYPQNILVIDDEVPILKLLSSISTNQGHKVDTAENGNEGVQKVKSNSYDIIITEIRMPGKSGCYVLEEARKAKGNSLPVIGMSGTPWLLEDGLFDAVLVKPFSRERLFEVMKNVIVSS